MSTAADNRFYREPTTAADDGGPAFPTDNEQQTGNATWHFAGMTLRDYFAAKAMAALLYETIKLDGEATTHRVARDAYRVADAMLKARSA